MPASDLSAETYTLTITGPGVNPSGHVSLPLTQQKHTGPQDSTAASDRGVHGQQDASATAAVHTSSSSSSSRKTSTTASSSSLKPRSVTLTLHDLQQGFPQHSILTTLQCAGNRRNDMRRLKEFKGGPWEAGAIGTALWTGPWLREVLAAAGVDVAGLVPAEQQRQQVQQDVWAQAAFRHLQQQQQQPDSPPSANNSSSTAAAADDAAPAGPQTPASADHGTPEGPSAAAALAAATRAVGRVSVSDASSVTESVNANVSHVWFEGYDNAGPDTHFLVSVPILDALSASSDVLLALQMNGQRLPSYHGFPVRVIVPGHVGVRSVKWLKRIVLSAEEARSHWQQSDYKMLPPSMDRQLKTDWAALPAMQTMPVQSAICVPAAGQVCEVGGSDGCIELEGYAWSGGAVGVIRVEVTADDGKSWTPAELLGAEQLLESFPSDASQHGITNPCGSSGAAEVAAAVSGRQGYNGRAWAWTLWKARVPVSPGLAKAAAAAKGQTTANEPAANDSSSSSSRSGPTAEQQEHQEEIVSKAVQKQDKQQQEQQAHSESEATGSNFTKTAGAGDKVAGPMAEQHTGSSDLDRIPAGKRAVRLAVKAMDARYNSQPGEVGSIWNIRGVGTNSWHTVEVFV